MTAKTTDSAPERAKAGPVAAELAPHGYAIARPLAGAADPVDFTFVLTRDEIYVPVAVRKPRGKGPHPVLIMGRGDGKAGMPHVEREMERLAPMHDAMLARGYAIVYVNYRNEIPHLYEQIGRAHNLHDDVSGDERRTLKSAPTLDSDDLIAIYKYAQTLPYARADAIGAVGVSHSGEMILKAATEITFAAAVAIEGASHEFLGVDTGPAAPRIGTEIQYQDIEVVRRNADKPRAMERIRRIKTPVLHIGRDSDNLQGIFKLAHEWMQEAGKDTTWQSYDHPEHGFPFIYREPGGAYRPDPVQREAFELFMAYFDAHLK